MPRDQRWDRIWSEKQKLASGKIGSRFARDVIYRTVARVLRREVPEPAGKSILEPGSGTGLVSLDLAKKGARVVVLDISAEALRLSATHFGKEHAQCSAIQGSLLALPFKANSFDVTWNAGVVEHFNEADQVLALSEMLRVTRPGGKVIVIVPFALASVYNVAKRYADRRGLWKPGYEVPITSIGKIADRVPATIAEEYQVGLIAQFHFLKYFFMKPAWLRLAWCGLVEVISVVLSPLNKLPGYLLVSVFLKADGTRSRQG